MPRAGAPGTHPGSFRVCLPASPSASRAAPYLTTTGLSAGMAPGASTAQGGDDWVMPQV